MKVSFGHIYKGGTEAVYNHRNQKISRGSKNTRIHILCGEKGKRASEKDFAVRVKLPKSGEHWGSMYDKLDKKRWVPMRISDGKEQRIVFANINSLAKRTGVSKRELRDIAKPGPGKHPSLDGVQKAIQDSIQERVKFENAIREAVGRFQKEENKQTNIVQRAGDILDEVTPYVDETAHILVSSGLAQNKAVTWAKLLGDEICKKVFKNQLSSKGLKAIESKFHGFLLRQNKGLTSQSIRDEIMPDFRKKLKRANAKAPPPLTEAEIGEVIDQVAPHLNKLRQEISESKSAQPKKFAGVKVGKGENKRRIEVEVNRKGVKINGNEYSWKSDLGLS